MIRLLSLSLLFLSLNLAAQDSRNVSKYNLSNGVGLKGYDPVAVFPEGGSAAKKGQTSISLIHEGVIYNFATEGNRTLFLADPAKFEPTYGGWCAFAMASGSQVDIQPQIFTVNGRRAHYFVSTRAKNNFDRDLKSYEAKADSFWLKISGESPRQ